MCDISDTEAHAAWRARPVLGPEIRTVHAPSPGLGTQHGEGGGAGLHCSLFTEAKLISQSVYNFSQVTSGKLLETEIRSQACLTLQDFIVPRKSG